MTALDEGWEQLDASRSLRRHDFSAAPYRLTAAQIKAATNNREPRILCYHDAREKRPRLFRELGLFILPVRNGAYVVLRGEGYVDLPPITEESAGYASALDFPLETSKVGSSEMQHLDFAYATSVIRSFMRDDSLQLTIRGRKRTPAFTFRAGGHGLAVAGAPANVHTGYEGREQIVLVEAKNRNTQNLSIRRLFYPFRKWSEHVGKPVRLLVFESHAGVYTFWQYAFADAQDYHSIRLERTEKFRIQAEFSGRHSAAIS